MNFSVFVPRSRQIGTVVVGLMPAPPMYRSLNARQIYHIRKKRHSIKFHSQLANRNGETVSAEVTEAENARAYTGDAS